MARRLACAVQRVIGTGPGPCAALRKVTSSRPFGRYDTVLLSDGSAPGQGLRGISQFLNNAIEHSVLMLSEGFDLVQIRLIFHPVWSANVYLVYAERFDIVPQLTSYGGTTRGRCPDPVTGMYVVKRSSRSNGTRMGGIVPLSQLRIAAPLIPRYGPQANPQLTSRNSLEFSTEFYLNCFFDKELYYFMRHNDL